MRVFYTPHRGTIQQVFEKRQAFRTVSEAIDGFIEEETKILGYPMFTKGDIYIRYNAYDSRIQCETFMIYLGRYGAEDYLKKHGCHQAYGWLHFGSDSKEKVAEWRYRYAWKIVSVKEFVEFFDSNKRSVIEV